MTVHRARVWKLELDLIRDSYEMEYHVTKHTLIEGDGRGHIVLQSQSKSVKMAGIARLFYLENGISKGKYILLNLLMTFVYKIVAESKGGVIIFMSSSVMYFH